MDQAEITIGPMDNASARWGIGSRAGRSRRMIAVVWISTLLLCTLAWFAAFSTAEHDRAETLARAQRDSANLTRIIAEQTARAIADADRILSFIGYDLQRLGSNSPLLRDFMKAGTLNSDLLLQLAYADANGDLIQTSVDSAPAKVNLADREHFRVHKEGTVQGLFISRPVFGRASGKWSIQLSRRVSTEDGGFGGMIVASLDPFYFSRTFDDINVGKHGIITIFGDDGILRARNVLNEKIIGQDISGSKIHQAARQQPEGFLRSTSPIDGVERLLSYRHLPTYPLVVTAGFDEQDFMAETEARRWIYMAGAGGVSVLLLVLASLVSHQHYVQVGVNAALKESARHLRVSREKLRDIAETASDWFWETNADLKVAEITGNGNARLTVPVQQPERRWDEIARRHDGDEAMWNEFQRTIAERRPFRDFELPVTGSDGDDRVWAISGKPVHDDAGRFLGYRGSGSDVTDQHRAEQSLAASEQRYRAMFEAVEQPIVTTDQKGIILEFNPAAERLAGYHVMDVLGRDSADLVVESERAELIARREATALRHTPRPGTQRLSIVRKDGTVVPVEYSLSGWHSDGREFFIAVLRDITEAKQIEDRLRQARDSAEHANRMKSEFLATISHEIRTPMNGVLGTLMLLANEPLTSEQARLTGMARRSAESLLRLLDDILDFSKLEAGRVSIDEAECDPARVAQAVLDVFQSKAAEKGIALSARMLPSVPDAVTTDPARLRQILFNLVGNAVKFTTHGHVAVRGRRGADLDDGRFMLEFEVEDTGIGIAPENLPHLFERFSQGDSSISRRFGGTGLGLAICRELCLLLGGDITVSSAPGKGSVFQFSITCSPASTEAHAPEAEENDTHCDLQPLKMLIVDDNDINLEIVKAMLKREGHTVVTASNGYEAVQQANSGRYDVILMDVQMPEMDGLVATRLIRGVPGPNTGTPIIALTAHASRSSRPECIEAGMDGFVTKPVRCPALCREMHRVLAKERDTDPVIEPPPRPAAAGGVPLIDWEQIKSFSQHLGSEEWSRLVDEFRLNAKDHLTQAATRVTAGDEAFRRDAHAVKGMSWNIGAKRLGDLALSLEGATSTDGARQCLAELEMCLAETYANLTAYSPSTKPQGVL